MLGGFGTAPVKGEGGAISFDDAQETYTARYTHETIALAFSITEEAIEDNLYDRLAARYTRALARSMSQTKQIKAAAILNNAFSTGSPVGDGAALCSAAHPSLTGNQRNQLTTPADLNETSLEQMLIDIAGLTDERGLKIAVQGKKLIIPKELQFIAERLISSTLRPGSADNDVNATKSMGMIPDVQWLTTSLLIQTHTSSKLMRQTVFKYFQRTPIKTAMEADFDTGNMRFKARERYSFGFSDPRAVYASAGAA
jgi:hypothetical protein